MNPEKQVAAKSAPAVVPPAVHQVLRTPGRPLEPATREAMESHFHHDFGAVRVHVDRQAAESADAISARAYTRGQDIVFGKGRYAPQTHSGQLLLAHELVHTIQQSALPGSASPHQDTEREAVEQAHSVLHGARPMIRQGAGPAIQRQEQSPEEIEKQLEQVRHDLGTGIGVRTNEAFDRLRADEQRLSAELDQARIRDIQKRLEANKHSQSIGIGVRSPQAVAQLKDEQMLLESQLAGAVAVTSGAPGFVPPLGPAAPPGSPFIDFSGGNLRGLAAEPGVRGAFYPQSTPLPRGFPGVDFIQGGQRTPLTGTARGAAGTLPLSSDSVSIQGGTLIQLKTMKNSLEYYQDPNNMYKELSKGLEKLANFSPGTGKSERVGGEYRRVESTGQAERKVLHVELETEPTPQQQAQLQRLQEDGKSFGEKFGPGEEIDVVVSWPGKTAGSAFKISSTGVVATAGLALGIAGAIGRQRLAERQLETQGYAPRGLAAHADDSFLTQLGAFFRGDQFEDVSGQVGALNTPVWRENIRKKTQDKKPGDTIGFRWQFTAPGAGILRRGEDVPVIYEKQPDGSWRARPVSDAPEGFHVPDLNKILDPQVGDGAVEDMLSSRKSA